jgi:predicted nucleic acid-binding protein
MTRIFWDTMLFIYLFEGNPKFAPRVQELLDRHLNRGDKLITSYLALGEVLVGARGDARKAQVIRETIDDFGFSFVPFDSACVDNFAQVRFVHRLKQPDSMNLAVAAAAKVDMFLTNDGDMLKKRIHLPGIHFIVDFMQPVF